MPTRWDDDDPGHGVGDAGQLVPGVSELVAAFSNPTGWLNSPRSFCGRMSKRSVSATSDSR